MRRLEIIVPGTGGMSEQTNSASTTLATLAHLARQGRWRAPVEPAKGLSAREQRSQPGGNPR